MTDQQKIEAAIADLGEVHSGVKVIYRGREYTTGNSHTGEVELWENGSFVRVVKIKSIKLASDENQKDE